MSNLKLYKFYWDCGRDGDLEGLFLAKQEDVSGLINMHLHLGEVLGKHSEIYGLIKEEDISFVSDDSLLVSKLSEVFESTTISGYNPFDYVEKLDKDGYVIE